MTPSDKAEAIARELLESLFPNEPSKLLDVHRIPGTESFIVVFRVDEID